MPRTKCAITTAFLSGSKVDGFRRPPWCRYPRISGEKGREFGSSAPTPILLSGSILANSVFRRTQSRLHRQGRNDRDARVIALYGEIYAQASHAKNLQSPRPPYGICEHSELCRAEIGRAHV